MYNIIFIYRVPSQAILSHVQTLSNLPISYFFSPWFSILSAWCSFYSRYPCRSLFNPQSFLPTQSNLDNQPTLFSSHSLSDAFSLRAQLSQIRSPPNHDQNIPAVSQPYGVGVSDRARLCFFGLRATITHSLSLIHLSLKEDSSASSGLEKRKTRTKDVFWQKTPKSTWSRRGATTGGAGEV